MVVSQLWYERQCIGDVDDPQPKAAPKLRDVAIRNLKRLLKVGGEAIRKCDAQRSAPDPQPEAAPEWWEVKMSDPQPEAAQKLVEVVAIRNLERLRNGGMWSEPQLCFERNWLIRNLKQLRK